MDPNHHRRSLDETYLQIPRSLVPSSGGGVLAISRLLDTRHNTQPLDHHSPPFSSSSSPTHSSHAPVYLASKNTPSSALASPASFNTPATPYLPSSALPPSQASSAFPLLAVDWLSAPQPNQSQDPPQLRTDPPSSHQPGPSPGPPTSSLSNPTAMSAVALQYDYGGFVPRRPSFAWPTSANSAAPLDRARTIPNLMPLPRAMAKSDPATSSSILTGPDNPYGSDMTYAVGPSASRSSTGSPLHLNSPSNDANINSRNGLKPDQHEFRRQWDLGRRDSKLLVRSRRTGSASSVYSPPASASLTELASPASTVSGLSPSSTGVLPAYTVASAPVPIPMLAEPQASASYQPAPFPAPLSGDSSGQASSLFAAPSSFSTTSSYMSDYYGAPSAPPLPDSHFTRPLMTEPPSLPYAPLPQSYQPGQAPSGLPLPDGSAGHVRVVQSRPKPQCWDHGCNGRQFSTFSNLLRHQREKSGHAAKASCPNCGAEFTRTTARNGHLLHDKCKPNRGRGAD